jgi:hypothetical protein
MHQQPCQDIQQTLGHITAHINQSLTIHQTGAQVASVSKMETPQGAYTFRISGVTRPEDAVDLIKRAIGDSYIHKSLDRNFGTLDIVILAEGFDRETYAQADNLFKNFQTHQRTLATNGYDDYEESDEYEPSHKKKSNALAKRKNKFASFELDQSKMFFACLIILVLGLYVVGYVSKWLGINVMTRE